MYETGFGCAFVLKESLGDVTVTVLLYPFSTTKLEKQSPDGDQANVDVLYFIVDVERIEQFFRESPL